MSFGTLDAYRHLGLVHWHKCDCLGLDLLHYIGPVCWIADPLDCWSDDDVVLQNMDCHRAKRFSTALFCIPLWISILLTMAALIHICVHVQCTTRRIQRRTVAGGARVNALGQSSRNVRAVAWRAVLYSVAFVITWTASTIWSVAQWFDYYPFGISYTWTLLEPLQGFWNCLIFLHNRPDSRQRLYDVRQYTLAIARNFFAHASDGFASKDIDGSSPSDPTGGNNSHLTNRSNNNQHSGSRKASTDKQYCRESTTLRDTTSNPDDANESSNNNNTSQGNNNDVEALSSQPNDNACEDAESQSFGISGDPTQI